jgi:hypothetical protein
MTFLPILERELRVRARSRAHYWGRLAVAAAGVMVCVPPLIWSGPLMSPGATGRGAFNGLVSACFLLCCAGCLFTADTISVERREGTLGLLLLTRVRHLDVLLGKFASSGLTCLLGLLAFSPVLALPILAGGVTGGEAARKAVVLLDTLFLALCVGLWASARGFQRFRAARAAVLVLTALVLGPWLLSWLLPEVGLASPLGTLSRAADFPYRTSAGRYWLSLALVQAAGWAFLAGAMASLRGRAGRDGTNDAEGKAGQRTGAHPATTPPLSSTAVAASSERSVAPTTCRYCGKENLVEAVYCQECGTELHPPERPKPRGPELSSAPTPLHWLLRRQRGLKPMLWVAAVIGACHFAVYGVIGRYFSALLFGVSWGVSLVATTMTGALVAWVASRFFIEARRSGELELLLTTPLGAEEIVSTQWDLLKRWVRLPALVMLVPLVFQGLVVLRSPSSRSAWELYYSLSLLLSSLNLILGLAALCWLGMWFGLRVPGPGRAVLWTVLLVHGLPWVLNLIWSLVYRGWILAGPANSWWSSGWVFGSLLPRLADLAFYWWLIRLARGQLLRELAGAEPLNPLPLLLNALPRIAAAVGRARRWPAA